MDLHLVPCFESPNATCRGRLDPTTQSFGSTVRLVPNNPTPVSFDYDLNRVYETLFIYDGEDLGVTPTGLLMEGQCTYRAAAGYRKISAPLDVIEGDV